jgi:hypothetical protein
MLLLNSSSRRVLAIAVAFAIAIPAIGQDNPESILPPGFGDEVDEPDAPQPNRDRPRKNPTNIVPTLDIDLPTGEDDDTVVTDGESSSSPRPRRSGAPTVLPGGLSASLGLDKSKDGDESEEAEDTEGVRMGRRDLPPEAQRSMDIVGIIDGNGGDLGVAGFSGLKGQFLSSVMRKTNAPIASRWGSILLRRALLSQTATPTDVNGADWVAERAWLLLRMGEADSARMLVQAVDTDNYTPKMLQVAMQAALATGDPSGMCPMAEKGESELGEPSWPLARAMCHGLSGESAQANAAIDRVRDKKRARGIDVLLAEKVVGAGANTRRAVMIQWDDVKQLTAWRFGLASATGVQIPPKLLASAGPQVLAWQARSPLMPVDQRIAPAEQAAALGVMSAPALVDLYGLWFDMTDAAERGGKGFEALRTAFTAQSSLGRVNAMKALWDDPNLSGYARYSRLLLTAQAAARLKPAAELAPDSDRIIASMLSAGLDKSAARWGTVASSGADTIKGWGLLAVGAPQAVVEITPGRIDDYKDAAGSAGQRRAQFLFAGLAGLGRIATDDINDLAEDFEVPVGRKSKWSETLQMAANQNARASVALLCAAGLQSRDWSKIPPAHLYHVITALRKVGLESEARMIAAEALTRT